MKIDRDTILVFVVCFAILALWGPFAQYMGWVQDPQTQTTKEVTSTQKDLPDETSEPTKLDDKTTTVEASDSVTEAEQVPNLVLSNEQLELEISPNNGAITSIGLLEYLDGERKNHIVINQLATSDYTSRPLQFGALGVSSANTPWTTTDVNIKEKTDTKATILRTVNAPNIGTFVVEQTWDLVENYTTIYNVTIHNPSDSQIIIPEIIISAGEIQRWSKLSNDRVFQDPVKISYSKTDRSVTSINAEGKDKAFYAIENNPLFWTSLSNKYFIEIICSDDPFFLQRDRSAKKAQFVDGKKDEKAIATTGAEYRDITIAANSSKSLDLKYYSGPKTTSNLEAFTPNARETMHLSWGPLDYLARFLLWALIKLKSWVGSFGLSIIILTITVRFLFFPATAKANSSMRKMAAIQPRINEIKERYANDPQTLQAKTMEVYREEKVNPFGGCLPMLLQIPVFISLYGTLAGAVELRHQSFLWCTDLAAADTITTIFGFPINPLVIIWAGLMLAQQALTPSTMEPMQRRMMMIMPLVMLFVVYNLPSGLTLYWTISQIFSIIQMLVQQKINPVTKPAST